jgi:hypothetical protein
MSEEENFGSFFGDLMKKHSDGETGKLSENIGKILKKKKVRTGELGIMSDRGKGES